MPRALSSLVAVTTLALTGALMSACTADGGPAATPTPTADTTAVAVGAHTAGLIDLYVGNSTATQDRREGRCFAQALQGSLDEQALVDTGIVGSDGAVVDTLPLLDQATAMVWVDAQLTCVDYVDASTRALLTQTRGSLDAEAYADCLRSTLSDDDIRGALTQTLSGGFDSPEVAVLAAAQAGCAA